MMKLKFQTKEESNKAQQEAFLRLMKRVNQFPTKAIKENSNNFIIEIPE